jgi:hypothetical protein
MGYVTSGIVGKKTHCIYRNCHIYVFRIYFDLLCTFSVIRVKMYYYQTGKLSFLTVFFLSFD